MWRKPWFLSQGPVLGAPCHRVTLAMDASLTGSVAVMSGHPAHGLWSGRHLAWHINFLEMLAMFRALKHFLPDLRDRHVLYAQTIQHMDFLYQPPGRSAFTPLIQADAQDPCVYIPGHVNMGADILSMQGPRPGEWVLPFHN